MQTFSSISGPISQRAVRCLEYTDIESRTLVAATVNDRLWNLNSIFDPDRSGAGHQPLYRDQLSAMYGRYRVFACAYRIDVYNTDSASSSYVNVCVVPNNSTSAFTDMNAAMEAPGAMTKTLGYSASSTSTCFFSKYINLPQLNGVSAAEYKADDRFQAALSSDPTEQLCLHVVYLGPGTSVVNSRTHLRYWVELFDPIQQATS